MKNCKRCDKEIPRNNYCGKCYTLNFRERNPGRMEELCAKYYEENKNHVISRVKQYNKENSKQVNATHNEWVKRSNYFNNRYNTDIQYKLIKIQRARIHAALHGKNKSQTTQELIGCSTEFLKDYIESKFEPGMTWNNYSVNGWHIDHIKPISLFDLTDPDQLKEACCYINLQPMWAEENLKKSNKTIE
jgi:hypothetical protein